MARPRNVLVWGNHVEWVGYLFLGGAMSKEAMLIAEVTVLTEMVRVLSDKVAELEKQNGVPVGVGGWLTTTSKQEQGEPVEWGVDWGKDGNSVAIIKRLAGGGIEVLAWEYAPHPQQRTWVGLTPEEVKEISLANRPYVVDMVVALEAKLKEKNT